MTSELTKPDRKNWQLSRASHKNIYSLSVVPITGASEDVSSKLAEVFSGGRPMEFSFPVNPKSLDLEEPAAVVIKPTQGGGQFIEHQGQIYKNITLSGTTGLRPNPKKLGAVDISSDTGLLFSTERTGFDDLIDLRNLFRGYYMAKVDPDLASKVIMIWRNGKEGEYYVVEPINFKTGRDSSSPLTANYNISLRTIRRLDRELVALVKDSLLSRRSAFSKSRTGLNKAIQVLADGINFLNTFLDELTAGYAIALTDILKPANDLFFALSDLANTAQRTLQYPRHAITTLSSNLGNAIRSITDAAYTGARAGISIYNKIISTLRSMRWATVSLEIEPTLFSTDSQFRLNVKKAQYIDSVFGEVETGGDELSLSNESMGSGVGQSTVGAGDNIRKLAKRLLGTTSRWKALVIANGLKAPYISADGDGVSVLRPGDFIVYPTIGKAPNTSVTPDLNRTLSPVEERLGRDVKITSPTSAGGVTQFDLSVGSSGDIELIDSMDNMAQAIRIKFETEQGELALHPFFGIKYPLGVKVAAATGFTDFAVNARATILSDRRVGDVDELSIDFAGNTLDVKATIVVKGFDGTIPFDFTTRR